ncbi:MULTISPECIES: hypothetical protein [unclassified Natrinema]|uniref:hypothetical protein n=1 Tax=unclassified Natrinema TaxID=2622230 RepID=UPI0006776798|nr:MULTISPECIES: hypothetical protein [unclassified Natrinema]
MSEAAWAERLDEATVRLDSEVTAERCADRYDVDGRDEIVELTNTALGVAFENGFGSVALEDLDVAGDDLGVIA